MAQRQMLDLTYLQLALYLAIIGGITRFRSGISSPAQRGWFISWALCGIFFGNVDLFRDTRIGQLVEGGLWVMVIEYLWRIVMGTAAVGGLVVMVQQYMQFVEC